MYGTPWESFRAQSLVLRSEAFSELSRLRKDDYEGWAAGLARTGYLNEPAEAEKIVQIIESLELFLFDRAQL